MEGLIIHKTKEEKMENGCNNILLIGGIIFTVILSIAGVSAAGVAGILVGPLVVGGVILIFNWIYS